MSIIDKPIVKTLMLKGEKGDPGDLDSTAIVDNLTTNRADKVLSAKQGKVLKDLVDANKIVSDHGIINLNSALDLKANTADVASEYATKESVNNNISSLDAKVNSLASGSPLVASSISGMTDTTRIYVNTTDGHWYWYNGSAWTDGGVYQASEDSTTLTDISNEIKQIDNELNELKEKSGYITATGSIAGNTGSGDWTQRPYTTDFVSVSTNEVLNFIAKINHNSSEKWFALSLYDEDKNFITRTVMNVSTSILFNGYDYYIQQYTVSNTSCKYVRFSYRSYGDGNVRLVRGDIHNTIIGYQKSSNYLDDMLYNYIETNAYNYIWLDKLVENGVMYDTTKYISTELTRFNKGSIIKVKNNKQNRLTNLYIHKYNLNNEYVETYHYINAINVTQEHFVNEDCNIIITLGLYELSGNYYDHVKDILTDEDKEYIKSTVYIKQIINIGEYIDSINQMQSIVNDLQTRNFVNYNSIMKTINHRGWYLAPENTLPAYKLSSQHGFIYVETDVRITSDGVPVLIHDSTINRTARNSDGTTIGETINIADITYEQALTYDFGIYKDSQYAGTKIPTYEQFISLCRKLGLKPYIELKVYDSTTIDTLIEINEKYSMSDNITWIGSLSALESLQNKVSSSTLLYVAYEYNSNYDSRLNALKANGNKVGYDIAHSAVTSNCVNACKTNDWLLEVWTINNPALILNLDPYVTGVTSETFIAGKILYNNGMQ